MAVESIMPLHVFGRYIFFSFLRNNTKVFAMGEEDKARRELDELILEHKQINEKIAALSSEAVFDQILVMRMKKRKLQLKDRISFLREFLCDDIVA